MKSRGDKGEKIVIDYFKKKGVSAKKAQFKAGYDVKAGNKLIEVKATAQTIKQKSFFNLTENEFLTACKNKNYWLYWVDTKNNKIIKKISRDEILENVKPYTHYGLQLSKLKKGL